MNITAELDPTYCMNTHEQAELSHLATQYEEEITSRLIDAVHEYLAFSTVSDLITLIGKEIK